MAMVHMPHVAHLMIVECSSVQFAHKSEKGTLVSERKTTGLVLHAGAQTLV